MTDDALPTPLEALAEAVVFDDGPALAVAEPEQVRALRDTAALAIAATVTPVALPAALRRRLEADALAFCAQRGALRLADARTARPALASTTAAAPASGAARGGRLYGLVPGMLAGLAAGLMLAMLRTPTPPVLAPEAVRTQVLAAADAVTREFAAGPSPLHGDVHGDVVWSSDRQSGCLRLRGLPPPDKDHQFQLWIVDGRRTGAPVDGGVFDVAATGETLVPVQARLPVGSAAAFVITVEPRGGVVVSTQEHVVAIARL